MKTNAGEEMKRHATTNVVHALSTAALFMIVVIGLIGTNENRLNENWATLQSLPW
jgi:hypothetical protein